jgi:hypothetical protein
MVTWAECAADFVGDGSLRDIYVLEGGIGAWNALLGIARTRGARFSLDGIANPLPETVQAIFDARRERTPLLSIDWDGIEFVAHFFDQAEVELDFLPTAIQGQDGLDRLCSFLGALASATEKEVIVTPENFQQSPILRAGPRGQIRYEPPKGAT